MENLYRDAPISAPFNTSAGHYNMEEIRKHTKEYIEYLLERVSNLDPEVAYRYNIMPHLVEFDEEQIASWNFDKIQDLPKDTLRDLATLVENTENILRENPKLLD